MLSLVPLLMTMISKQSFSSRERLPRCTIPTSIISLSLRGIGLRRALWGLYGRYLGCFTTTLGWAFSHEKMFGVKWATCYWISMIMLSVVDEITVNALYHEVRFIHSVKRYSPKMANLQSGARITLCKGFEPRQVITRGYFYIMQPTPNTHRFRRDRH